MTFCPLGCQPDSASQCFYVSCNVAKIAENAQKVEARVFVLVVNEPTQLCAWLSTEYAFASAPRFKSIDSLTFSGKDRPCFHPILYLLRQLKLYGCVSSVHLILISARKILVDGDVPVKAAIDKLP